VSGVSASGRIDFVNCKSCGRSSFSRVSRINV
jgi:hypothetical protein